MEYIDKEGKKMIIVAVIIWLIMIGMVAYILNDVSNKITDNGGLGTTIGVFIKNINNASK